MRKFSRITSLTVSYQFFKDLQRTLPREVLVSVLVWRHGVNQAVNGPELFSRLRLHGHKHTEILYLKLHL